MKGKAILLFIAVFGVLTLLFPGNGAAGVNHGTCPISRVAYIPGLTDNADDEEILINHSHLHSVPENTRKETHRFRVRGLQRSFNIAWQNPASFKTSPVASASLKAPPRYQAPDCVYPQHIYLFRLTPF